MGVSVQDPDASRPHERDPEAPVGWTRYWPEGRSALPPTLCGTGNVCRPLERHSRGRSQGCWFDGRGESIDIAERLESWQKAGDERLWKLIVSPEFGDRADLKRLTRDLASRMEKDLGVPLEWVPVAHYNTEHPRVHMALRGVGAECRSLHLSRDYIKLGIREIAEDLCSRQLGHRTELDAAVAQRREVRQHRYTSLDRIIKRGAEKAEDVQVLNQAPDWVRARVLAVSLLVFQGGVAAGSPIWGALAARVGPDMGGERSSRRAWIISAIVRCDVDLTPWNHCAYRLSLTLMPKQARSWSRLNTTWIPLE
jgi:Transmembrane secretion effector